MKKKELLARIESLERSLVEVRDQLRRVLDPLGWEVDQNMRKIGRSAVQQFWNAEQDALKPPFVITSDLCAPAVTTEPLTFDGLEAVCNVESEEVEFWEDKTDHTNYAGFRNRPPYKR